MERFYSLLSEYLLTREYQKSLTDADQVATKQIPEILIQKLY